MDEKALRDYWKLHAWEVEEVRNLLMASDAEEELVKYGKAQLNLDHYDAQQFAQDAVYGGSR